MNGAVLEIVITVSLLNLSFHFINAASSGGGCDVCGRRDACRPAGFIDPSTVTPLPLLLPYQMFATEAYLFSFSLRIIYIDYEIGLTLTLVHYYVTYRNEIETDIQ